MARLEGKCPGDCTKCKLLEEGKVEMEVCMLDQIFQRTQRNERVLARLVALMEQRPSGKMLVREEEPSSDTMEAGT